MGKIILERRKTLKLTQEQVAKNLHVSIPAVSKWETGATTPDVMILPKLARLLQIDMNELFSFHPEISDEEIGKVINQCTELGHKDVYSAFEFAKSKLEEFPCNEKLKLSLAIILDALNAETSGQKEIEAAIDTWCKELSYSKDECIQDRVHYLKASMYVRNNSLELAQDRLDKMKGSYIDASDKLMLQVSIYSKQKKYDQAILELEKDIFNKICKIQVLMLRLIDLEMDTGQIDVAKVLADKMKEMAETFDLGEYGKYIPYYEMACRQNDADQILKWIELLFNALQTPWDISKSPLYHKIAVKEVNPKEMLTLFQKAFERDSRLEGLKETDQYQQLFSK